MNKKPILVFAPEQHLPLIEGIQKSAYQTCQSLNELGESIEVFSQQSFGTPFTSVPYSVRPVFDARKNRFRKYLQWFLDANALTKNIHDQKALLVFSLDWSFLPTLWNICRKTKTLPIEIAVFSMRELTGPARWFLKRYGSRSNIHYWCFSSYVAKQLETLGIQKKQMTIGPVFFTKPIQNPLPCNTSAHQTRIAYLSSSDAGAGVEKILSLATKLPEAHFTLAIRKFSDREEGGIQQFLANLHERHLPNIEVKRNIPNMPEFFSTIDVVILPPMTEIDSMAVPLVALEAAYAGCKVLMSRLPLFEELEQMGIAHLTTNDTDMIEQIHRYVPPSTTAQHLPNVGDFAKQIQSHLL